MGSVPRGPADYWSPGDWNIICSICGTKLKFSQAVRNWQGMWRHVRCDEPRHPQDFVHARNSQEMTVPYPQHMLEGYIYICLIEDTVPMPGQGVPGCMLPGSGTLVLSPPCTITGVTSIPGYMMPGCATPSSDLGYLICTADGMTGMPGSAMPGCSIPGN